MSVPRSLPPLAALLLLGLGACTIAQLRQDVQTGELRVHEKQEALAVQETRRQQLLAESRQLDERLQQKELSLGELQSILERLQRQNAQSAAERQRHSATRQQLTEQLREAQAELDALRQQAPPRGATQGGEDPRIREAQARQAQLQKKLRRLLEIVSKVG